ncbi:MAG: long-chain fatty acid--CoA ligase [Holophagales bacterium]|nr:long-chain fatty acid--CoA ligase [Holophagales bacterium]
MSLPPDFSAGVPHPGTSPGADILGHRARLTPDAPALVVVEPELRLTYRQLDERARRCARLWTEVLGLAKGDRVGILAHNRVEYLEAFFAAGKTGVILVTLGTRLTAPELEHVVRDSGLRALLYDAESSDTVARLAALLGEGSEVEHWIAFDPPSLDGHQSYGELASDLTDDPGWRPNPCQGEDVYCLLYTSGTTGKPKGVRIPHRMVLWNGFNTVCGWQLRADDVSPIFTPLYHAGGLMAFLVPVFVIGGTIVLHRGFDPSEVWQTIEKEGCTVVLGVPTIWKMLLEAPEFAAADLGRVRWLISGGAPLPQYLIEAYQQKRVVFKQGFGMTEVGVNCFAMTVDDSYRKAGSIGKPMMFTEVRLVDAENLDVPVGEVGELLFRGPHVCQGYWRNPEATASALDADGWFHTGDQARRDQDGFYYVAGRQKEMIISGGVNVYPAEIEAVLVQHPRVEDAAVVAVPDERWGEVGVAFVVLRDGENGDGGAAAEIGAEALAAFLAERLARYKIPKDFRFLPELPRTAYGKVVKGDLRHAYTSAEGPGERP